MPIELSLFTASIGLLFLLQSAVAVPMAAPMAGPMAAHPAVVLEARGIFSSFKLPSGGFFSRFKSSSSDSAKLSAAQKQQAEDLRYAANFRYNQAGRTSKYPLDDLALRNHYLRQL